MPCSSKWYRRAMLSEPQPSHDRPTAALLIIGNELLTSQTRDENGPFMLRALRERGIEVLELRMVADNEPAIARAINDVRHRCSKVLTTGGIGPTHDDVTMRAVAHAFGVPLVVHAELMARVLAYFGEDAPPAARRLAEVPEGAEIVLDTVALVPIVSLGNVTLLPGVPKLMRNALPQALAELRGPPFFMRGLSLQARETDIAQALQDVQHAFEEVSIGSYPHFEGGRSTVHIHVDGRDAQAVDNAWQALRRVFVRAAVLHRA